MIMSCGWPSAIGMNMAGTCRPWSTDAPTTRRWMSGHRFLGALLPVSGATLAATDRVVLEPARAHVAGRVDVA